MLEKQKDAVREVEKRPSDGAARGEAKPTPNREQYQACLNIAEVRRRKTKSNDGSITKVALPTPRITPSHINEDIELRSRETPVYDTLRQ